MNHISVKMKKIIYVLLLISTISFAQSAGNSGMSFLKIGFGARNVAMSDLGVVNVDDVTAINYNPALISNYSSPQIMLTHNQWIQDASSQLIGASFSMFGLPFAFGVNTTSIDDIEVRTTPGEPESNFNAHYFYSSLSTGFNIYNKLSTGFTIRYLYEGLFSDEATGWGFDIGFQYKDLIEGLDLGTSLKNMGSMNELRNQSTKLPLDFRLGASYSMDIQSIESDLNFITGIQKYLAADNIHLHFGGEIFYDNIIAFRLGYVTGYESKGFTTGLGLYWKGINFDYAFTPFTYNLGSSHTISLMYTF